MIIFGMHTRISHHQATLTHYSGRAGQRYLPPAHRARETIELLQRQTPDFITPDLWPPNSPDLNPVDYRIWGVLQECVYRKSVKTWMNCSGV